MRPGCLIPLGLVAVLAIGGALATQGGGDDAAAPTAPQTATAPAEPGEAAAEPTPEETTNPFDALGVFDSVKESGRGDDTIALSLGNATAAIVKAKHSGTSNFVVESLNDANSMQELLVNQIGSYSGTTLLQDASAPKLKVSADGPWTVTIEPVSEAKALEPPQDGKGDQVLLYSGPAADWAITHKGSSNFAVNAYGQSTDLLVNEIGDYSGTVPVGEGPSVIVITADGTWTIKAK